MKTLENNDDRRERPVAIGTRTHIEGILDVASSFEILTAAHDAIDVLVIGEETTSGANIVLGHQWQVGIQVNQIVRQVDGGGQSMSNWRPVRCFLRAY